MSFLSRTLLGPSLLIVVSCSQDKGITVHNTAPNATIESPDEGATSMDGEPVQFSGIVGDAEDGARDLTVVWSSDLDGVLQEGMAADDDGTTTMTTGALSIGGHTIVLKAIDPKGKSGEDVVSIIVNDPDEIPEIYILNPAEDEDWVEDVPFAFSAVVTDNNDAPSALSVVFSGVSNDGDEALCEATPNGEGLANCSASLPPGSYTIVASVEDSDGNLAQDFVEGFEVLGTEDHDGDEDGFTENQGDCDDENDNVHPDAPEVANGVDDNCDGNIDEGTNDYDDDGDGFTELDGDCDDDDDSIHPGADEVADGIDNDCDGEIDENTDDYDDDGDGFSEAEGDCDDTEAGVHPDATEIANGIDDDCDGDIDEGTDEYDDDGDGYSEFDGDCDDTDDTVYDGAPELLDGVDNDCDDAIDEGTEAYDDDGDCFCEESPCMGSIEDCDDIDDGDCDDDDEAVHPDAAEICDTIDNDCDEAIDGMDPDTDGDSDGYSVCIDDCDDTDDDVHPGADEECDGVDNNCDDTTDEDTAIDASTWYEDDDEDGFGDAESTRVSCDDPTDLTTRYVANDEDCDDTDEDIHPDATEVCDADNTDEDCDGFSDDEDAATGHTIWFRDLDDDGYGDSSTFDYACDAPSGYVANNDDCDDWCASCYPGATEVCDDRDNDCDDAIDEEGAEDGSNFYLDEDGDGWGHGTDWKKLCDAGDIADYDADNNDDCCDTDWYSKPGATSWQTGANDCGSHDWDCDGEEKRHWETLGACGSSLGFSFCYDDPAGWMEGYVPPCGTSWYWLTDCDLEGSFLGGYYCDPDYEARSQECY